MKKTDKIITNNLNDQIAQLFSTLKMPAANQTFQNQQKSPDYVDMPFSVRLHHILRAEVTAREEKRKSRLYKESGINDALPSLVFSFVNSLMYPGFEIPLHRACAI